MIIIRSFANKFVLFLLLAVIGKSAFSQNHTKDIGLLGSVNTVRGDMQSVNFFESFRPSFGIVYRHNLNYRFAIRGMADYGWLYATGETDMPNVMSLPDQNYYDYRYGFSRHYASFSGIFEMNWKEFSLVRDNMKFSPYLGVGIGGFFSPNNGHGFIDYRDIHWGGFIPKDIDLLNDLGAPDFYLNPEELVDQESTIFTATIPIVFGAKFSLKNWWSMAVELYATKTFSDKIDNLDDPYQHFNGGDFEFTGRSTAHNNDWLFGVRLMVLYQIGRACSPCPVFN